MRRKGKSVLPELLREFGFDKAASKGEETVAIIFDEGDEIYRHVQSFPVPIIKSGEIFTFSPIKNEDNNKMHIDKLRMLLGIKLKERY